MKYGYNKFKLEILEYCDKDSTIEREQYYIDNCQPTYNICKVAGSSLGRMTRDVTRLKLRNSWVLRTYKNNSIKTNYSDFILKYFTNKVDKLENNISIMQAKLDSILATKIEFKQSDETRLKKLNSSKTAVSIVVTDITTNITKEYPSARNAALALNVSNSTIMNKLRSNDMKPYKNRYLIRKNNK